jgi:3',5'-cyclic-nucleotide phosphodiesterase
VHAGRETIKVLREHIFNWLVWPDFTVIPGYVNPMLRLEEIRCGQVVELAGRQITAIPARHAVPAMGYLLGTGRESLAFSGDTAICDEQIATLNSVTDLRYLIVEAAFPESQRAMAEVSCHLSSGMLHEVLDRLTVKPEVFVTHLKPGYVEDISREVMAYSGELRLELLKAGQRFELKR